MGTAEHIRCIVTGLHLYDVDNQGRCNICGSSVKVTYRVTYNDGIITNDFSKYDDAYNSFMDLIPFCDGIRLEWMAETGEMGLLYIYTKE